MERRVNCLCGVGWGGGTVSFKVGRLANVFSLLKEFMFGVWNTGFLISRMMLASGELCLVRISALGALRSFRLRSI